MPITYDKSESDTDEQDCHRDKEDEPVNEAGGALTVLDNMRGGERNNCGDAAKPDLTSNKSLNPTDKNDVPNKSADKARADNSANEATGCPNGDETESPSRLRTDSDSLKKLYRTTMNEDESLVRRIRRYWNKAGYSERKHFALFSIAMGIFPTLPIITVIYGFEGGSAVITNKLMIVALACAFLAIGSALALERDPLYQRVGRERDEKKAQQLLEKLFRMMPATSTPQLFLHDVNAAVKAAADSELRKTDSLKSVINNIGSGCFCSLVISYLFYFMTDEYARPTSLWGEAGLLSIFILAIWTIVLAFWNTWENHRVWHLKNLHDLLTFAIVNDLRPADVSERQSKQSDKRATTMGK